MKKKIALILAIVLLVAVAVAGTIAWLMDDTQEVKNTFTVGDINIKLDETDYDGTTNREEYGNDYKMIPGWTIDKDPKATVETSSEDCYLFVQVEETGVSFIPDGETMPMVYSFSDFLTYEIADGWTKLEDGVYYKVFDSKDSTNTNVMGTAYSILKDDQVTVRDTVTKKMMDDLETYNVNPELSFTAYAVQLYKNNTEKFTAEEAWGIATADTTTTS